MLNETKGNMYNWVTHTWNTVKGECPHQCTYCYMKKWGPQRPIRFVESELKTDLGSDNFIFVGSSCDLFANQIPADWILKTLDHCRNYTKNRYLFQTKNPWRIPEYRYDLPVNKVIGATIESDGWHNEMGESTHPTNRVEALSYLADMGFVTMVTIEPIMDFNLDSLVEAVRICKPQWVNIGANTNSKVKLPEPPPGKIKQLVEQLEKITEIKIKPNLKRLLRP